jgi:hypothetical protein
MIMVNPAGLHVADDKDATRASRPHQIMQSKPVSPFAFTFGRALFA